MRKTRLYSSSDTHQVVDLDIPFFEALQSAANDTTFEKKEHGVILRMPGCSNVEHFNDVKMLS
jgi:hypothetical protein